MGKAKSVVEALFESDAIIGRLSAKIRGQSAIIAAQAERIKELGGSLPEPAKTPTGKPKATAVSSQGMTPDKALREYNKIPANAHSERAAFREKHAVALGLKKG